MCVSLGLSRTCPWPHSSDVSMASIVSFFDLPTRITLSKVSHYFRELLESEGIQRQLLSQQSFKPLLTAQESTFQQYARFTAMHSAYPSMVRYFEEPISEGPACVRMTSDGSKMVVLSRRRCNIVCYELPFMKPCWTAKFDGVCLGSFEHLLQITPDGKKLVFYDGHRVNDAHPIKPGFIVIDMQTGQQILKFAQEEKQIRVLAMNPDGKSIDTVSIPGIIKRWDLVTGDCVGTFKKKNQAILQISPNGQVAISKSVVGEGDLIVWDVKTGEILQTLKNSRSVDGVAWNKVEICQNNELAIVWSSLRSGLQVFDLSSGLCIANVMATEKDSIVVDYFRMSPNGKFILVGNRHELAFFNLETKRFQKTRPCEAEITEECVYITPDGTGVMIGTNRSVEFWNFCELPEEHLSRMYKYLVKQQSRPLGRIYFHLEMSSMLPQVVKDEIREISFCCQLSDIDSYALYNATQEALPAIQKHLERATKLPNLSQQMASEAIYRILALPNPVKKAVCINFCAIRKERFGFLLKKDPFIEFTDSLNCKFFIPDFLQAIQCTRKEYQQKYPMLEICLENFRKGQGTLAYRIVPLVSSCVRRTLQFLNEA